MRKRATYIVAATCLLALLVVPAARAQPQRFDPASFRAGEKLWVTTDSVLKGTLVDVRSEALVLDTAAGRRTIPVSEIERVHRRRNGKVVGTLVGAGIGLASGVAFASLLQNEGGNGTLPAVGLTALGGGVGYGVDAALGTYQVIYERPGARQLDTVGHRVRASVEFGPATTRFAGRQYGGSSGGATLLMNVGSTPVWLGFGMVSVRANLQQTAGFGPVAQVDVGRRTRAIVPYVTGGALFGEWGPWGLGGGGVHVRLAERAGLRVGGLATVHRHERVWVGERTKGTAVDAGLQVGFVYR